MIKQISMFSLLAIITVLSGCSGDRTGSACIERDPCLKDKDCLCWCSQLCNFRKKTSQDRPQYVENDSNGKFCYCKQWDIDNYNNNCILKKNVKQPAGAR